MTGKAFSLVRGSPRVALFVFAFLVRAAFVTWAQGRFPATADGTYYDIVARRIAHGAGYTWLWPDGVVTYATHYPIGYPALLAVAYKLLGESPGSGMWMNALVTAAIAPAVYELAGGASRRAALAGVVAALHPALVPYTAALMTEGVVTTLLAGAGALVLRKERAALYVASALFGAMTLMRPQMLLFAPVFGAMATPTKKWKGALVAATIAVSFCLPWTFRNCRVMDQCTFVSANGGTNLLIGVESTTGGWHEVPKEACPGVFGEVAKDVCYGKLARAKIAADVGGFVRRMPKKLEQTFDYFGAAPYYLHASNAGAFPFEAKVRLGATETLFHRGTLVAGFVCILFMERRRRIEPRGQVPRWRGILTAFVAVAGIVAVFVPHQGFAAHAAAAIAVCLHGGCNRRAVLFASVVFATALIHAVFFGAGRYGLVLVPFVVAFAFRRLGSQPTDGDEGAACAAPRSLS